MTAGDHKVVTMKRPGQWEAIEHGLDVIGELIGQIGTILIRYNHGRPVEAAVKLTNPDLATIFEAVTEYEEFVSDHREDGHSDSIQQLVMDLHLERLRIMGDLCRAMEALDQGAVDKLMEQLRAIQ